MSSASGGTSLLSKGPPTHISKTYDYNETLGDRL